MEIHREGEFFVWEDLEKHPLLGIDSANLESCLKEVKQRKIYGVFGNPTFGFKEDNLDFLRKIPDIKSVWFWDVELKDINGLYECQQLLKFGVHEKRPPIDFHRLPHLKEVTWIYKAKDSGIATLQSAKIIYVWHYKPSHKSYKSLELPPRVERLELYWANPASLDGLPTLSHLRELEIHRCKNLQTLEGLPQIAPNLERLLITNSGTVTVPSDLVKSLPKLKRARVNDQELI